MEGSQRNYLLAFDGEPLATGGNHAHIRARLDDPLGDGPGCLDEVLAVVEHQEQFLRLDELNDAVDGVGTGPERDAQGDGDHLHERAGAVCRGQLAKPGAVAIVGHDFGRHLQREARSFPHRRRR